MTNVYEAGVLVGWYDESFTNTETKTRVFIPRRDENIEADRINLDPEHPANWN